LIYKEILVIVDQTDLSLRRINFAAQLAAMTGANCTAFFL